jgi:SYP5 family syntaxin
MLQALKRDQPRSSRSALLDSQSGGGGGTPLQPLGRETDTTAELDNRGLVSMQQHIMQQQDTELEHLERSVATTKHVALQINEETSLHNRLLDELDIEVGNTQNRLSTAQKKLKNVMRRAASCKTQLLVFLMVIVLILVILIGFKVIIHL